MKKICFLLAIAVIAIAASCNNESSGKKESNEMKHDEKEMKEMKTDSMNMNKDSTMNNNKP